MRSEFPQSEGFSRTNLYDIKRWFIFYSSQIEIVHQAGGLLQKVDDANTRQWYLFYNQGNIIWQQPVAKLGEDIGQQVVAQLDDVNMQQPVAQISEEVFFSVPWGHHLYIISQCKDVNRAVFYLKKTVGIYISLTKIELVKYMRSKGKMIPWDIPFTRLINLITEEK